MFIKIIDFYKKSLAHSRKFLANSKYGQVITLLMTAQFVTPSELKENKFYNRFYGYFTPPLAAFTIFSLVIDYYYGKFIENYIDNEFLKEKIKLADINQSVSIQKIFIYIVFFIFLYLHSIFSWIYHYPWVIFFKKLGYKANYAPIKFFILKSSHIFMKYTAYSFIVFILIIVYKVEDIMTFLDRKIYENIHLALFSAVIYYIYRYNASKKENESIMQIYGTRLYLIYNLMFLFAILIIWIILTELFINQ